ncbi:hypothetical protein OCOJLMKI_3993 [Methylobacterium iners]|uniref:Uncharacterized protein n=1 Tax=Methylobacterium iners TaxID=418707 RepID=A0ABQ4S4M9_9HYPH|nr:hypothetical protein OCOJLMKI_3993 [Methylobacterium iners]
MLLPYGGYKMRRNAKTHVPASTTTLQVVSTTQTLPPLPIRPRLHSVTKWVRNER